jgi:hypothetical protein
MPHSEQDPHDFGDGLYLTFQQWLGEQYARLRSSDTGGRPVVYQGETTWRELGRILDLTSGQTKREWEGFLDSEYVPGKTWRSIMPPANPNKNYWTVFSAFLEKTGRKLENYDTIVGPEYVRTGVQLCVRNPGIQQAVEGRFVEWDAKPVWIRVLNASGEPLDVNINFPGSAGEANRQFVKERFQAAEKAEREKPEPGEPALSQPPVVSPGARGVAGVLAALEIIRIGLELAAAIRDMPTAIQRKLDPIRRIWSFWNQYGVRCTVLGLLTGGNIAVRGLPGVPDDAVKPATGRILWGLSPMRSLSSMATK